MGCRGCAAREQALADGLFFRIVADHTIRCRSVSSFHAVQMPLRVMAT